MSAARVYDYLLGGSTNFRPDREAAAALQRALPSAQRDVWANRSFLGRAVAYLLDQGVTQFLDLGSGLPTVGNVHEVAHARDPGARVVYVDCDPVAVEHARDLLEDIDGVAVLESDLRDVGEVLNSSEVRDLLDFSRPIGLLAVAVLHFVARCDDPVSILGGYAEALVPGSHLVISHATGHTLDRDQVATAAAVYADTDTPLTLRTPMQVAELFTGFTLLPPADGAPAEVVPVSQWRPDPLEPEIQTRTVYGGVGLLPAPDGAADVASSVRGAAPRAMPPLTATTSATGVRL
ncbi:SAM-dependent methyltransferase [Cryptosporangium sp. NPDC048952]|uniref:SAM-dependent methyltransferase n=1 Tax=Cryptosporangium sp. NPDC048952 TaxID=3363961 RepID=UPI0037114B48